MSELRKATAIRQKVKKVRVVFTRKIDTVTMVLDFKRREKKNMADETEGVPFYWLVMAKCI